LSFLTVMGVILYCLCAAACTSPGDDDPSTIIGTDPCSDPWRNDTARVRTTIRFEALVDTMLYPLKRFSGSGLRVSVVLIPPYQSPLPYLDVYSVSANYLDIPATGLPFQVVIPPGYFRQYDCARLASAFIVLYRDDNENEHFDIQETIYGADEQSLYAFTEGEMSTVSKQPFESVFSGNNVLIRMDNSTYPRFRSSPDYLATIFIINVRGDAQRYNIPLPWPVEAPLFTSIAGRTPS